MTAKGHCPPQSPVPMAQECTEGPLWSPPGSTYVPDHFHEPSDDPPMVNKVPRGGRVTRVRLSKAPSPTKEPLKFFVRPAGGMSIPVPELDTRPAPRNLRDAPASRPRPHGEEGPSGGNYLPLSVELIAGRGQTSMPSDGSKGGSGGGGKVKSLPPSHTLAMSASLLKSYFTSSSSSANSSASSSATSSSSSPATEKQQQPARSMAITPDTETSVKTKMLGIWNNVKYGWTVNLKTNFSRHSPVYLLGSVYHKSLGENDEDSDEGEMEKHGMEAFKRHFHSLVWCTYRRQFPTLQDSTLTTDCGWGCMLRSGQMMVAQALTRHFLPKDWRHSKHYPDFPEEEVHRSIIRWFGDSPSPLCPLSLHNLVHLGHKLGKWAGDWYGPASVAYIFKEAVEMGSKYIADLQRVCVYVAQDCAVYIQDVLDLCSTPCVCNAGTLHRKARGRGRSREGATAHQENTGAFHAEILPSYEVDSRRRPGGETNSAAPGGVCSGTESRLFPGAAIRITSGPQSRSANLGGASRMTPVEEGRTTINATNVGINAVTKSEENGLRSPPGSVTGEMQCPRCDNWRSVVIMVPVRLGGDVLNPIYASCIFSLFTHDLCIGIIGGRPKHSLYFVGFQEESLIHLDPHLCQDAVAVTQTSFSPASYHCSSPRKMALSRMDPSATLGFYCHSRTEFLRLMEELPELLTPKEPGFEYPIFEFLDGCCPDVDACTRQVTTEDEMAASLPTDTPLLPQDSEEFVFL